MSGANSGATITRSLYEKEVSKDSDLQKDFSC